MTQEQVQSKVKEMLPELMKRFEEEAVRLFNSGSVDTSWYDDSYTLPRICLTVAIENQAYVYSPPNIRRYKKEMANLRHF